MPKTDRPVSITYKPTPVMATELAEVKKATGLPYQEIIRHLVESSGGGVFEVLISRMEALAKGYQELREDEAGTEPSPIPRLHENLDFDRLESGDDTDRPGVA